MNSPTMVLNVDKSQSTVGSRLTVRATGRGIVWVQPSEMVIQARARSAGLGIDPQTGLARRTRRVRGPGGRGQMAHGCAPGDSGCRPCRRSAATGTCSPGRTVQGSPEESRPCPAPTPHRYRLLGNTRAPACQEVPHR